MTNPDHYKPLEGFNAFSINADVHGIITNGKVKFVSISGGPVEMSEWDFGTFVERHLRMRVEQTQGIKH